MSVVSGILDDVVSRPVGKMTMYDIVVEGQKYGNGPRPVTGVAKGDRIQFEVAMNGQFKNVKPGTLKKWEPKDGAEEESKPVVQARPTYQKPYDKDDYWRAKERRDIEKEAKWDKREEEKQARITFEAARKQALEYVSVLGQTDSLFLKKMDKAADRQEYIRALFNDLTREFYEQAVKREAFLGKEPLFDEDLSVEQQPEDGEWQ